MKPLLFLTTIVMLSFSSCNSNKPLIRTQAQNNTTYEVAYLFEHDGCKVYRFTDDGRYVYFTNCTGDVTAIGNDSIETKIQTVIKRN